MNGTHFFLLSLILNYFLSAIADRNGHFHFLQVTSTNTHFCLDAPPFVRVRVCVFFPIVSTFVFCVQPLGHGDTVPP